MAIPEILFHKIHGGNTSPDTEDVQWALERILAEGLEPMVAREWCNLVPLAIRHLPVVWLAETPSQKGVCLSVSTSSLEATRLLPLELEDEDWWVYQGLIPSTEVSIVNAKIVLPWMSSLLINQAYNGDDPKKGRKQKCIDAMFQIKMMLTSVGHSFDTDENRRIKVVIDAYRPRTNIDPDGLIKAVNDAIKHGIHVDDRLYDTTANGFIDRDRPRIEIELTQED